MSSPITAKVVRQFRVKPDVVFNAWITGDKIRKWFSPGLGEIVGAVADAREGGQFLFVQRRGLDNVEHIGKYLVFDRPYRLGFTWQVKGIADVSKVHIDFEENNSGTELTLSHELNPHWANYREKAEASWSKMLEAMAAVIE